MIIILIDIYFNLSYVPVSGYLKNFFFNLFHKGDFLKKVLLKTFNGLVYINKKYICRYYKKLEQIFQPSNQEEKLEIYDFIQKRYPRADAPRILPLHFLTG